MPATVDLLIVFTELSNHHTNCVVKKVLRSPGDRARGARRDGKWIAYDRITEPEVGEPWEITLVDDLTGLSFTRTTTPVRFWRKFWSDGTITDSNGDTTEESHGSEDQAAAFAGLGAGDDDF
jgi:hypothetical protein